MDENSQNHQRTMEEAGKLLAQGDLNGALVIYHEIAQSRKAFLTPRVKAAHILHLLGQYDEALEMVTLVLKKRANHKGALLVKARTLSAQGQHLQALDVLREASGHYPEERQFRFMAASQLRELGRLNEAEAEVDAWMLSDPSDAKALLLRGKLAETRQKGSGQLWFEQVLQRDEKTSASYLQLARNAVRAGDITAARALLEEAHDRFTDTPRFAHQLARLDWQQGLLESAYTQVTCLAEKFPHDLDVHLQRIDWAINLGEFALAAQLLAESEFPDVKARQRLAVTHAKLAAHQFDFQDAQEHMREALMIPPTTADWHQLLARYYLYTLDLAAARAQLESSRVLRQKALDTSEEGAARAKLGIHGAWLNEFSTNPFANERLRQALSRPPIQRLSGLADVLREEPGHTPTAILLMVELRRVGWFDRMAAGAGECGVWPATIPRKVVKFWNTPDVPEDVAKVMASWSLAGSGFEVVRFDEESVRNYLKCHFEPMVLKAYLKCQTIPMKADLFRLAYLFSEGGVYSDADDLCRHPLERMAHSATDLMLYQEELGSMGNNFIAAAPHHSVIGDALDHAVREILDNNHSDTWFTTGPGQMTRAVARQLRPWLRFGATHTSPLPQWTVLCRHELLACISMHIRCNYHHTHSSWQIAEGRQVRLKNMLVGSNSGAKECAVY